QYFVVMEVAAPFRQNPESLKRINFSPSLNSIPSGTATSTSGTLGSAKPVIVEGASSTTSASGMTVIGATNNTSTTASVPTGATTMTPLSAVSDYKESTTSLAVNHQGQFPAVTM